MKGAVTSRAYVAAPRDDTLPAHLHEAFKLLEIRFANYDHDGAETLMFKELERELSLVGFSDTRLEAIFKRFDFDGRQCGTFVATGLSNALGLFTFECVASYCQLHACNFAPAYSLHLPLP